MSHPEFWDDSFFFEIFSWGFFQPYLNPDFAPYQPTNMRSTNMRSTNMRLLRSRERGRELYLFYKCSTSSEVVALPNDLLI